MLQPTYARRWRQDGETSTPPRLVMGGEEDPRRKVDCRSRVLPFTALNWITDSVGRRHGALLTQDPFEESYCFS